MHCALQLFLQYFSAIVIIGLAAVPFHRWIRFAGEARKTKAKLARTWKSVSEMNQIEVDFYIKSLSHEEILCFLKKNENDHFEKLSKLVDLEIYAKKLSENALHFTLYDKEELVGFCASYFNDDISKVGYISIISIALEYRALGLGGELINHIIVYARQNLFKEIEVKPDCNNKILIDFFTQQGFFISEKIADRCLIKYIIKENV